MDIDHERKRWFGDIFSESQWGLLGEKYCLTARELQISKLVCRGGNNESIAKELDICDGTVKTHIRNIYRKTWVHNKVSMLLLFMEDCRKHTG